MAEGYVDKIKEFTSTYTTNVNGLLYVEVPTNSIILDAYVVSPTDAPIALMRFSYGGDKRGYRAYNLSQGRLDILANSDVTVTATYY